MTHHAFKTGVPLIVLMGVLTIGTACGGNKAKSTSPVPPQTAISIEKAITLANTAMPGRIIEAELEEEDEKWVYEVEIVTADGKIHELEIDAQSGEILKTEEKD